MSTKISVKSNLPLKHDVFRSIGSIENLVSVRDSLYNIPKSASAGSFSNEDGLSSSDEAEKQRQKWLQNVFISVVPDAKLLVLTSSREISVLAGKFRDDQLTFAKLWNGTLTEDVSDNERYPETITCCSILPIASKHRTADPGVADWNCVIYGFKSGYVAFHTESGYCVHRQQLDTSSVCKIKLFTHLNLSSSGLIPGQELMVAYENGVVVTINGTELYSCLQNFKSSAADAASRKLLEDGDVENRSVPHEKYQLQTQQTIHDVISLGSHHIGGFDQLLNASNLGGRSAVVRPPLPSYKKLIAVGGCPLFNSYYVPEGDTGLELGEVAKAVANRVTTAVSARITGAANRFGLQGLLGRAMPSMAKATETKQRPLPKAARSVDPRYSFSDERRCASTVVLSGSGRMAAMSDFFGRVLLLNCQSGIITRMWKGYRSAEVAWITVVDSHEERNRRFVECLVIYAPRRRLVEVWSALSGRRLVALHVQDGLRLLPAHPFMLQLQPLEPNLYPADQCYFLDQSGRLFTLDVPFFLTEEGANLDDAKDSELVQEIKENFYGSVEKITKIFGDIQGITAKDLVVDMLMLNSDCRFNLTDVRSLIENELNAMEAEDLESGETESIVRKWRDTLKTIDLYQKLDGLSGRKFIREEEEDLPEKLLELSASTVFPLLSEIASVSKPSDSVQSRKLDWRAFIPRIHIKHSAESKQHALVINEEVLSEYIFCSTLFAAVFEQRCSVEELMDVLDVMGKEDLTLCLINLWMDPTFDLSDHLEQKLVCLHRLLERLHPDGPPDQLSLIHNLIEKTQNVPAGLTLSFVIIWNFLPRSKYASQVDEDSVEWESICKEFVEWTRMSQRLESLISLQGFLLRFKNAEKSFLDAEQLSVRDYLSRGHFAASEYVASWISNGFLEVPATSIMKALYSSDIEIALPSIESEEKTDRPLRFLNIEGLSFDKTEITEALSVLKAIFPKALHPDALLAECGWALMAKWNKNPQEIWMLISAMDYLKDVVNGQIIHGVAYLVWKNILSAKISSCLQLIEKTGKSPKERLFLRDLSMTESAVHTLLALSTRVLMFLQDADTNIPLTPFALESDFLWVEASSNNRTSIVLLATQQPRTWTPIVKHHTVLVTIMLAIMEFNLKGVRPLALFDSKGREAFFMELTAHPLLSVVDVDETVTAERRNFLSKSFAALVRASTELCISPNVEWVEKLLEIAAYWEMTGDEARSFYVYELYSNGLDELAEMAFNAITDKQPVLARLLTIAGQRIAALASGSGSQGEYARYLSSMSPVMGAWLKSMESGPMVCQSPTWKTTSVLVRNIANTMRKGAPEYKLCMDVFEWLQSNVD